jgi:hypothetical protein
MAVALPAAEVLRHRGMASRRHTPRQALIPEHLAVSIMEEWQEAFPPVGSRALAEASTGVEVSTVAAAFTEAADIGNLGSLTRYEIDDLEKRSHAHK